MGKALAEIGSAGALSYAVGQLQHTLLKFQLLPPQLRVALLRLFGAHIGRDSIVHPVTLSNLYRTGIRGLNVGKECFIGEECFLDLAEGIDIADQVTLAERVMVITHLNVGYRDHPLQEHFPAEAAPIRVGSGSFIGVGAIILPGVTLGERCFVAAGAVVSRDVPAGGLVGGVPARDLTQSRR
jgi:acetyltransferase-like isoleucine patch superfamily enzyme